MRGHDDSVKVNYISFSLCILYKAKEINKITTAVASGNDENLFYDINVLIIRMSFGFKRRFCYIDDTPFYYGIIICACVCVMRKRKTHSHAQKPKTVLSNSVSIFDKMLSYKYLHITFIGDSTVGCSIVTTGGIFFS